MRNDMNGLDKILEDIRSEASAGAQDVLQQAREKAKEIEAQAKKETDAQVSAMEEKALQQAASVKERSISGANLLRRRELLSEKQAIIAQVLQEALAQAAALPTEQYFALVQAMAARSAHPGEQGEICLSKADLSRVPDDFEKKLSAALPAGAVLTLSSEPADIKNGFLLRYGGIEENGEFRAVLAAHTEELQDKLCSLLWS